MVGLGVAPRVLWRHPLATSILTQVPKELVPLPSSEGLASPLNEEEWSDLLALHEFPVISVSLHLQLMHTCRLINCICMQGRSLDAYLHPPPPDHHAQTVPPHSLVWPKLMCHMRTLLRSSALGSVTMGMGWPDFDSFLWWEYSTLTISSPFSMVMNALLPVHVTSPVATLFQG